MLAWICAAILLTGCGGGDKTPPAEKAQGGSAPLRIITEQDADAMANETRAVTGGSAAIPDLLLPEAPGTKVGKEGPAEVDYSNTRDGYIMARFNADRGKRLKAQVKGPVTSYTYNMDPEHWEVFPLSDGNGSYTVAVYENVSDKKYATVLSVTFDVQLADEFVPFLRPNQYVDYANAVVTLQKAAELTDGLTDVLDKVAAVYDYVVRSLTYDKELAENVQSGYLPVLDEVLAKGKGICFDYAAVMTGMLRSQGIPCKLVVGYAGDAYHAWISVYSEEDGWIDNVIWFDGTSWQRMDPTFASSGKNAKALKEYIGDNSNYMDRYYY